MRTSMVQWAHTISHDTLIEKKNKLFVTGNAHYADKTRCNIKAATLDLNINQNENATRQFLLNHLQIAQARTEQIQPYIQ